MFDALLWDCFAGPNRLDSDGLSVAIRQVPTGTTVLAFRLDTKAFRRAVGIGSDGRCCDGLLFALQRAEPPSEPAPTLLLLEMKGRKLVDALEQIEATLSIMQQTLQSRLGSSYHRARFTAVVVSDRVPPRPLTAAHIRRFLTKFGASLYLRHATRNRGGADLGDLLRREHADGGQRTGAREDGSPGRSTS